MDLPAIQLFCLEEEQISQSVGLNKLSRSLLVPSCTTALMSAQRGSPLGSSWVSGELRFGIAEEDIISPTPNTNRETSHSRPTNYTDKSLEPTPNCGDWPNAMNELEKDTAADILRPAHHPVTIDEFCMDSGNHLNIFVEEKIP